VVEVQASPEGGLVGGYTRELDDGTVVYSASSIGYCSTALYYDRKGVTHEEPPENIKAAWAAGHHNEPIILSILETQKVWTVLDTERCAQEGFSFGEYDHSRNQDYSSQVRVEKRVGTGVVVRAHLDAILLGHADANVPGMAVGEAKAFGDSYWSNWKSKGLAAFPTYEWQVSVQMHATGLPLLFIVGKKNSAGVVDFVETELITTPPISWGKIAAKISKIENAIAGGNKPECELPIMYPCPFYPLHEDKAVDMFGQSESVDAFKVEGQLATTLKTLVERYEAHKNLADEHKREMDAAKNAILGYFQDEGVANPLPKDTVINADGVMFKAKPGGRKGSFNEAKIKAAGIDPESVRGAPSSWLSIEVVE
jgi:hypothetical protein